MMTNMSKSCRRASFCAAASLLTVIQASVAAPAGPTPVVPEGGGPPGPFPNTSVTAANVLTRGGTEFNSNVEFAGFEGQGPIAWAVNRYNRGDIAMQLSPASSSAANANTAGKGFIEFPGANDASLPEMQVWKPNMAYGMAIPTVRQNGPIDWGDGAGPFYPTIAFALGSSAFGYDMGSGTFGGGGLDVNTGSAGDPPSGSPEANFSFSVTWFPYDQGWVAGVIGNPDANGLSLWNGTEQHAAGLAAGLMKWREFPEGTGVYGGVGTLRLPGINAETNGMLFAVSVNGESALNIVGVAPTNDPGTGTSGWVVTVREDSAATGEEVASSSQSNFGFVFVPYSAQNLAGGYIDGATGNNVNSAGEFTIARTAVGTYEFSMAGKGATNGTLLLQAAEFEPETSVPMATRAFLSYEYQPTSGKFVIQSRKVTSATEAPLTDVDFYVAWVDFAEPLSMPDGVRMRPRDTVRVTDPDMVGAKEANLAINTKEPEVLVTTVDTLNSGGYTDPTSGNAALETLVGYFHDPRTLARTRGPFLIMGNPAGAITRHDVKYNPVSNQYVVVGNARALDGNDLLMIARVNPNSVAGENEPLVNVFVYDGLTNSLSYDDVAVAVSTQNGNFLVVAEHKVADEGEGSYGALFGPDGTVLTPVPSRLDLLQGAGDEDDPDVVYLPSKDVFLYYSNTDAFDANQLTNRIAGSIVQTTASANKQLQISGPEQRLAINSGPNQGHPAAIENPFNGELLVAFDVGGNDVPNGEISYHTIGASPGYTFTEARPQAAYLTGTPGNPLNHQHPQLAVDPDSGVIIVGYQARGSTVGYPNSYAFTLLGPDGAPIGNGPRVPYLLADSFGAIDTGANYHNVKYDPSSDSFLAVFTADNPQAGMNRITYLGGLKVTSSHLAPQPGTTLAIGLEGSNVVLRWPASVTGATVETKASLSTGDWATAPGTPTVEGGFNTLTIPLGNGGFYRLKL